MIYKTIKKYFITIALIVSSFFTSCDKEVSRSPLEPTPSISKIKIGSNPQGFLIYLNGRNTGSFTPDSLTFLDPGSYQLTLKRKYFKDTTVTLILGDEQSVNLNINLLANQSMFGKISVNSFPAGASILINDSLTGKITPYLFDGIKPGEYNIKLKLVEHRTDSFTAIVSSSNTSSYSKTLVDTSLWVDYQTFNSGILSNNLSCITIDKNGTKWIGSFDKGLIKFDGINFSNYNLSNSSLPSNRILSVSVDEQNTLWIGTDNGLAVYDGVSWTIYNKTNSGLRSNEILCVKFGPGNEIWIGAYTGLYKFDGINWTRYNDTQSSIWTNDLEFDNGKIWIATTKGVVRLNNNTLEYFYDSVYNYPTRIISTVEKDAVGNIWFGHLNYNNKRNGISYYNGSQFNNYFIGTTSNAINNIFIDENNIKWISTSEGLAKISSNNELFVFNKINSNISSDKLSCSTMDANGDLWITTYYSGLVKFKFSKL